MRKPNLEDVVAHGSDYPVPQVAVPDHHDQRRPLTVCLWDAPNMDASLFSVTGADHHTIVRPQYDAFSRWLVNQRPPSPSKNEPGSPYDVEALLFLSVVSARSTQVAPFVTAARQSGFTVFCRDRDEGDIDDAIVAVAGQRLAERNRPGTLLVLGRPDPARWRATRPRPPAGVIVVAYRNCADGPRRPAMTRRRHSQPVPLPLDRFDLSHLPTAAFRALTSPAGARQRHRSLNLGPVHRANANMPPMMIPGGHVRLHFSVVNLAPR
jgi:hypothetical protein